MYRSFRRSLIAVLLASAALLALPSVAQAADRDCPDFASQAQAQAYFTSHGGSPTNNVDRLDADGDGRACEGLPSRAAAAGSDKATRSKESSLPFTGPGASLPLALAGGLLLALGGGLIWRLRHRPAH